MCGNFLCSEPRQMHYKMYLRAVVCGNVTAFRCLRNQTYFTMLRESFSLMDFSLFIAELSSSACIKFNAALDLVHKIGHKLRTQKSPFL